MEHLTLFLMVFVWLVVLVVCFENMFLIMVKWYHDYKNNKKLEQLKKDLKIK